MKKLNKPRGELAERIIRLREARGWTGEQLAEYAGIPASYIRQVETGRIKTLGYERLITIAQVLGVDSKSLVEGTEPLPEGNKPWALSLDDSLQQLLLARPTEVKIYSDFLATLGKRAASPVGYTYVGKDKHGGASLRAWLCNSDMMAPDILSGTIVVVDRAAELQHEDCVLCRLDGGPLLGVLRKVDGRLWLENNNGRWPFDKCMDAGKVIRAERDFVRLS